MDCIVHGVTKSQIWLSDFHTTPWRSDGISRPKIRQIELALPYLRVYLKCFMIFQDLIFWYIVFFSSLPGWLWNSSFKNGAGERPLIAVCYWGNKYFDQPSAEIFCGIWLKKIKTTWSENQQIPRIPVLNLFPAAEVKMTLHINAEINTVEEFISCMPEAWDSSSAWMPVLLKEEYKVYCWGLENIFRNLKIFVCGYWDDN